MGSGFRGTFEHHFGSHTVKHYSLGHRLPHFLSSPLFGDRRRFGLKIQPEDPCWKEWQKTCVTFYENLQKKSVGAVVNNAGYRVMSRVDLAGRRVLELGPAEMGHMKYWNATPGHFVAADVRSGMLKLAQERLQAGAVPHSTRLLSEQDPAAMGFDDAEFDVVVSFYSLEHIHPLEAGVNEIRRVLKPGGQLVGAIPCEGGLGWGLGRFLTSRRWLRKNTRINPDKIICWEHPNFADGILTMLDAKLKRAHLSYWPLGLPSIDLNLVIRFVYEKR
jgi:SAM-dependent methyltransferase